MNGTEAPVLVGLRQMPKDCDALRIQLSGWNELASLTALRAGVGSLESALCAAESH